MKNTMTNKTFMSALTGILFVSVLTVGVFTLAPAVHAQEFDGGDYSGSCCGGSDIIDGYSSSPASYGSDVIDGYSTSPASYGSDVIDGYSTSPYEYDSTGYSASGYSTGGYSSGGYSTGGIYQVPVYHAPVASYGTPSNVYAPTTVTTNTCTGSNNCNTDNHSVVNISNPAPIINNVVANYGGSNGYVPQYCASGYYGTYPNCYLNQQPVLPIVYQRAPIAYNAATPYVSLTQVPYTGLDLGFWGTIAYWGAMVLFALVVAYLVAIKRVQNSIALKLRHFLLGSNESEDEQQVVAHAPAQVAQVVYATSAQTNEDVIDSFILSQVNRSRHA